MEMRSFPAERTLSERFVPLLLADWQPTRDAIHGYARLIGGVREALTLPQRHWGHVSLFVAAPGLASSSVPAGERAFELVLDLTHHALLGAASDGDALLVPLRGQAPAALYDEMQPFLGRLAVQPALAPELLVSAAMPYDPQAAERFCRVLTRLDLTFKRFAGELRRGAGAVCFWPHHFDLAMLWLTGRCVPGVDPEDEHNADAQMNFGFVTGDASIAEPYFYATAYPLPATLPEATLPTGATWHTAGWQGAVLPYAELVGADDPEERLLGFLRGCHALGAQAMNPIGCD
jgi:hypothetical protein